MTIHDWHNPHNEDCPQNKHWDRDCNCKRTRTKKINRINKSIVRDELLRMANSPLPFARFTQVKASTIESLEASLIAAMKRMAASAPKKGKTI